MAAKAINRSVSTPLRNGSPLVRRSMAITPISNVAETPTVDVRQERLSSINTSATTSNTSTVARQRLETTNVLHGRREDFMSYIKLFQSNKITKHNIWDVNLIRDFHCLVDMRDETVVGDLHLASVALDASAKIYSMRVDDVHQDVVRLASGLMRSDMKGANTRETVDEENNDDVDASGETGTQKKKKVTRQRKRKPRSHIVTEVSQINGEVEVNTELDKLFTSRAAMLGDAMTTDKIYSLTLDSCKGVYITDIFDKKIMNCDERADLKNQEKEFPRADLLKWRGAEINPSLSDFKFLDWDSEDITVCGNEDVGLNSSQLENAFDINAPVHQIPEDLNNDDSIVLDNNFDDDFQNCDEESENIFSEAGAKQAGRGFNEAKFKNRIQYTYDPRIKRIISKLYAGPLHYKFPFQQKKVNVRSLYNDGRTKSNSGQLCRVRNAKKAPPHQDLRDVDNINEDLFKSTKTNKLKGSVMLSWNPAKNILPDDLHLNFVEQNRCFLRKATNFNEKIGEDWANATSVDDAVPDYDYQNVNDSNFCAVVDNAELYSEDENAGPSDTPSAVISTQELVDAPELVNKVKINYDTKVRTVDMKVVKQFTWKFIREQLIAPPEGVQKKPFIMFSSVFAALHKGLPRSETENLTLGIASLSVMHITNDNNLVLEQGDNDDFKISPFPE